MDRLLNSVTAEDFKKLSLKISEQIKISQFLKDQTLSFNTCPFKLRK
jgi:hypothetical protein